MGANRSYEPKQRIEAVRLSEQVGIREASRRLDIPFGTIACWRSKGIGKQKEEGGGDEPSPESDGTGDETDGEESSASSEDSQAKTARRYTPSEKAQALEYASEHGVSEASRTLGMTRDSIYRWRRQLELAARGEADDPTSGDDPNEVRAERDRQILAQWKKHPGLGPSQIRNQLRRQNVKCSTNTVRRVMEDAGYRPPKVVRKKHDQRFEAIRPNHMWHLDFVHRHINKATTFTLILLDDHSRFVTGFGIDDAERADCVIETFEEATTRYGRPEIVMSDRGSAFWSWRGVSRFTRLLEEMGIDHFDARDKQVNGKVEVFNANLHKELFDKRRFHNLSEMRHGLEHHLWWYNHRRTHHALGGLLVPADRYYGRAREVMARIESGMTDDGLDSLDLRGRILDLVKVCRREGRLELWLMGQKVWTG